MKHPVGWLNSSPLWPDALADPDRARLPRPEVLRFDAETFMEDLPAALDSDPGALRNYVARSETGERPGVGWLPATATNGDPAFDPTTPIPLYQPAHQRFYLVAASLVCRVRGLPDRKVDRAKEESVSFVVRRVVTGSSHEYGWFVDKGWRRLANPAAVDGAVDGDTGDREERYPLVPVSFAENGNGRRRRLHVGYVPVGNRETYEAAPREGASTSDASLEEFDPKTAALTVVIGTLMALRDAIQATIESDADEAKPVTDAEAIEMFAFALLDLGSFLAKYLPKTWQAVKTGHWDDTGANQESVWNRLDTTIATNLPWRTALLDVKDRAADLLGDTLDASGVDLAIDRLSLTSIRDAIDDLRGTQSENIEAGPFYASANAVTYEPDAADLAARPPVPDGDGGSTYVLRCVYERPKCHPFEKAVVSAASQPLTLASFYDAAAPRRPTRIAMPDTSLAGLRRAQQSVSIVMSKKLREQMSRFANVKKMNDGPGPGQTFSVGEICTLSIPIITICALILLMILVAILNMVFFWLPLFKICLPIDLKEES